ncbi:MAG: hypothetical protein R3190_19270 [Thermoanaerobaculia bacterium]|nr:hypothetical protein [Thermoanaerobaculia bacterium]
MGRRPNVHGPLVDEARKAVQGRSTALGSKILVYPVELDLAEGTPMIAPVNLTTENLPDLGLVLDVGWKAMRDVYYELDDLERRKARESGKERAKVEQLLATVREHELIQRGDVVALNRFSGMAVPGGLILAYERDDLVCRLEGVPVKLKTAPTGRPAHLEDESAAANPARIVRP